MSNIIQINKEKLSKLLKNKNKAEMSRRIGYASNYLSHVIGSSDKSGKMSKAAVNALDIIYCIKYEDYKPEEQKNEEITEYSNRMSKQELYEIIYKAVYEAVKRALSK